MTEKFKTSIFYHYAQKWKDGLTEEQDIIKIDQTDNFYKEIRYAIDNKEYLGIQVNAKVRSGKSGVGLHIAQYGFNYMKAVGQINSKDEFGTKNICMDQTAYILKRRDPACTFTWLVVDEESDVEKTGHDATAFKTMGEDISNLHADDYVHTVRVSPKEITDPNCDLILTVISVDRNKLLTHCKLHYRYFEAGIEHIQLMGTVTFNVGDVIGNWVNGGVAEIYYKQRRMIKENPNNPEIKEIEQKLNKWEKRDWYVRYYRMKRYMIDLIAKHKIRRRRQIKYAPAILNVINRYKYAMGRTMVEKHQMKNACEMAIERLGIPQSLVGIEVTTNSVEGTLGAYKSYNVLQREKKKLNVRKAMNKVDLKEWLETTEYIENEEKRLLADIKDQEDRYYRMIKLTEEYERKYG